MNPLIATYPEMRNSLVDESAYWKERLIQSEKCKTEIEIECANNSKMCREAINKNKDVMQAYE